MKLHDLTVPYWRCHGCMAVVTIMRWRHHYDEEDWVKFIKERRQWETL